MQIAMDFAGDAVEAMRQALTAHGFSIPVTDTEDEVGYKFALMKMREMSARPRTVYVAKNFTCPIEHTKGLAEIRRKAEAGESLASHQRYVRHPDNEDALLNDWGVQHFHLGLTPRFEGTRTDWTVALCACH
jgi:hypothetical protein